MIDLGESLKLLSLNQQNYSHSAWSIARVVDGDYLRAASVKPTSNANGRLEDGGHDRGKKASNANTVFTSILYGGIENVWLQSSVDPYNPTHSRL